MPSDDIKLREYVESQIMAQRLLNDAKISALEAKVDEANRTSRLAIDRAADAVAKRFETTNEWRESLNDFSTRLVTREQVDAMFRTVDTRIDAAQAKLSDIEKRNANIEGRVWGVGLALGMVFSVLQVVLHFALKP